MTKTEIRKEMNEYIAKVNTDLTKWYVGIAKDPVNRLFNDHKVSKDNGCWIYRPADSPQIAREVEKAYLDSGAQGGDGGGDDQTKSVYAYIITTSTK